MHCRCHSLDLSCHTHTHTHTVIVPQHLTFSGEGSIRQTCGQYGTHYTATFWILLFPRGCWRRLLVAKETKLPTLCKPPGYLNPTVPNTPGAGDSFRPYGFLNPDMSEVGAGPM